MPETLLRLMTYNVHGCVGTDRRLDETRIAEVIAFYAPDVVALQELDAARSRSLLTDQARHIADHLKMDFHFHPALCIEEEQYGDAILSRLPMRLIKTGILPTSVSRWAFEPRGALLVALEVGGREVHLINTHLGLSFRERKAQIEALLSPEWMDPTISDQRFILCGDFNALPGSLVYKGAAERLRDVQRALPSQKSRATFSSMYPVLRVDHIFVTADFKVTRVEVPRTPLIRLASDHLPIIVDLQLP
ncbi:MAG: endonuclease/exonuclease/phosphatase family protein [Prosthecobacter sp.]|nr:endonuclease/exonuclease/phosphatase family protein [Prosthecobacter sp.]